MKIPARARTGAGVAVLEAAACTVVLALFGFGALGLCAYLSELQALRVAVDEAMLSSPVKSHRISVDSRGEAVVALNRGDLDRFLERSLMLLMERIGGRLQSRVEIGYFVAKIDPNTGAFLGFEPGAGAVRAEGSGEIIGAECPSLSELFSSFAVASLPTGRSVSAVPSGRLGSDGERYLPQSVFVGVRAFKDLSGNGAETLFADLGGTRVISSCKIQVLRGEVD